MPPGSLCRGSIPVSILAPLQLESHHADTALAAEIFPLQVRAKGNAWGVVGWSIGNGWLTLLCPIMFNAIGENTLHIFAACNFLSIPIVWAFYPESNQRTLEEMDLLFASPSPFVWDAEKTFERLRAERPELITAAQKGDKVADPEAGVSPTHEDKGVFRDETLEKASN